MVTRVFGRYFRNLGWHYELFRHDVTQMYSIKYIMWFALWLILCYIACPRKYFNPFEKIPNNETVTLGSRLPYFIFISAAINKIGKYIPQMIIIFFSFGNVLTVTVWKTSTKKYTLLQNIWKNKNGIYKKNSTSGTTYFLSRFPTNLIDRALSISSLFKRVSFHESSKCCSKVKNTNVTKILWNEQTPFNRLVSYGQITIFLGSVLWSLSTWNWSRSFSGSWLQKVRIVLNRDS